MTPSIHYTYHPTLSLFVHKEFWHSFVLYELCLVSVVDSYLVPSTDRGKVFDVGLTFPSHKKEITEKMKKKLVIR
jgi:hypothetical protein